MTDHAVETGPGPDGPHRPLPRSAWPRSSLRPLDRPQARDVGGEHGLQRLGEVLQQVEAVGDLHGPWCAAASAVGVGAGAVARHDLDPGMVRKRCLKVTLRAG